MIKLDELKQMLEAHNWMYMYAEKDEYTKGVQSRKAIDRKIEELVEQGISRNTISMLWASIDKGQAA